MSPRRFDGYVQLISILHELQHDIALEQSQPTEPYA
jgi:hypothetical protein